MFEQVDQLLTEQLVHVRALAPVTFSPFGSVLGAVVITYACKAIAVILGLFTGAGFSNAAPRDVTYKKFSAASRAYAAHLNGFEGLLLLAVAILMGTVARVDNKLMVSNRTLYLRGFPEVFCVSWSFDLMILILWIGEIFV